MKRRLARKDARAEIREKENRLELAGALHRTIKGTGEHALRQRSTPASTAATTSPVVAVPPRSGVGASSIASSTAFVS
jgi:hypothetical protein